MDTREIVWRLAYTGHEIRHRQERYWWDNRTRGGGDPDFCTIQYTLRGSVTIEWAGRRHRAGTQQAILYAYDDPSCYGLLSEDSCPYEHRWIVFHGAGLRGHWDDLRRRFGPLIGDENGSLLEAMLTLTDQASLHLASDPYAAARLVHRFVMQLYERCERGHDRRKPVERAVQRMLANPVFPWSLKELAAEAGCSREHLTRSFTRRCGHSPADWLNRQRLEAAKDLLRNSSMPVAAVAEQAGFTSTHTMARLLRRETGLSPTAFREALG